MNELSKLFSSALMLLAGFAAASFFGPPEVVDRVSQLFQPAPMAQGGLSPLPSATQAEPLAEMPAAWPALGQPAQAPSLQAQDHSLPAQEPAAPAESFATVSWPAAPAADAEPAAPPEAAAPGADEWLTAANLWAVGAEADGPTEGERRLEPVRRRGEVTAVSTAVPPQVAAEPAAPSLEWPSTPPAAAPSPAASPNTAALTLDDSPYGKRPTFGQSAPTGWDTPTLDDAPHRLATLKPVERRSAPPESITRHVVTDGDTLGALAERYLGDAGRAQELYKLNEDRLDHPDLLPIGMVLRVPERPEAGFAGAAQTPDGFPPLRPQSAFSTVSSAGSSLAPEASPRRPLQPVNQAFDRPLTEAQRLGPVDPLYSQEFQWEAARGW